VSELKIEFVPNPDEDYPFPVTAFLLERDGTEWPTVASADGKDPDDALEKLIELDGRAGDVKVKVPRWRRKARRSEHG
jgi:hypothetical protein